MATLQRMSVEEFMALPESKLVHELYDGMLVVNPPPTDRHEDIFTELFGQLWQLVSPRQDLELRGSHSAQRFGERNIFSPDIFIYVRNPQNPHPAWADVPAPLLVVEILSPSTAARDRNVKRPLYQQKGVEECWIMDPHAQVIERWRPGDERPEVIADTLHFKLSVGLEGSIDLKGIFARVDR